MNNSEGIFISAKEKYGMANMEPFGESTSNDSVTPNIIFDAYGIMNTSGNGVTLGIVTAYYYDAVQNDLNKFCELTGIEKGNITVRRNSNEAFANERIKTLWKNETALDVQWAHSIAPKSEVVCYFSRSDDIKDMFEMIKEAEKECDIVLLSFGTAESGISVDYEDFFYNSKALYVCASGNANKVFYPASSKYTLSVGATEMYFDRKGTKIGCEHYKKGGCGISRYIDIPTHQKKYTRFGEKRLVPDLSFYSGGNRGVLFYCSETGGIQSAAGTSVSAVCVAGICANIAERDKTILKEKASYFYKLADDKRYNYLFNDIVMGRNEKYKTTRGFDLCTGLGVPKLDRIIDHLLTLS